MATRTATRKTLFSLLGIFVISLVFFIPKATAYAVEMSDVFPSNYISDPCDPPAVPVIGYSVSIIKKQYLQVIPDGVGGESAYVKIAWKLNDGECNEGGYKAAKDSSTSGTVGKFDTSDEYGYWASIFDHGTITTTDNGIFLQVAEKFEPKLLPNGTRDSTQAQDELKGNVNYTLTDPKETLTLPVGEEIYSSMNGLKTESLGYYLTNPIPSYGSTFFEKGNGAFTVPISGLKPNTDYYIRVALLEDAGSLDVSYSEPQLIHTLAKDTPIPAPSGVIDGTDASESGTIIDGLDCGIFGLNGAFTDCLVEAMYYIIYIPSSWILAGTGYLFNAFASLSISSYMYSNAAFVTEGWKTVRDLVNMFFIFALLYAAIRIIISRESAGSIAPLIKNIIVAAILINFSLFIVKLGIDASNVTARIFYNAIGVTVKGGNQDTITDAGVIGIKEINISEGIVAGFGIQRITSNDQLMAINNSGHNTSLVAILLIFGIIINLTAAGVFFTVGVLFVGRIVGFYMAMLFAPLAFMSDLVPILGKIPQLNKSSWRENLMKDILLAPLFLFFIWVILGLANTDFLAKMAKDTSADWTKMLVMIALESMVILSMLVGAKKLAEGQASFFGGQLNAVLGKALNFVVGSQIGMAVGAAGAIGQATLGRYGASVANSDELKKKANEGGLSGAWARLKLGAGEKLQTSSFDFSKTKAMQGLTKATGVNLDKEIQEGKDQLKMAGAGLTAGASLFTNKRLDLDLEGGYKKATERGQKYREDLANSFLVTGLDAEDRDKRAKAWNEQFEKDKVAAEQIAKDAGAIFSKEAFKSNYEAGVTTRYVNPKTGEVVNVQGRKKVLSTKEENNRRLNEHGNTIEFGADYVDEKKNAVDEYQRYMQLKASAKATKNTKYLDSKGEFDINKFNSSYATGGKKNLTVLNSLDDKGIFNEDKFKNEYLTRKDGVYEIQKKLAQTSKDPKYIGADGKFNETWFRQAYVANQLNTAQNLAVSGMRKKAFEETKKDKELSKKESDRIKDSLAKATKQFDKIQQSIDNAKRITGEADEEDAVESMARVLDKEIIKLDLAVDAAKKAGDAKAQARAMYKKLQRQTQKKTYENALKNKRDAEQKINDNNTKLGE